MIAVGTFGAAGVIGNVVTGVALIAVPFLTALGAVFGAVFAFTSGGEEDLDLVCLITFHAVLR